MPNIKQWVRLFLAGFCAFGVSAAVVSCSSDNGASPMPGHSGGTGTAGVSAGGSAGVGGGGSQCAVGTSACSGTCVNLSTDALNCGACGKACTAGQVCSGTCMCQAGLMACPSGCANIAADGANCGACGMACPAATPFCSSSACVATCPADKAQCGTGCVDPATFQTDALNCGMCGNKCAAGQACMGGVCSCPVGQTACGGACVDLNTDVNHCGSCEKACAMGATCATGMCQGGGMGGSGGGGAGGGGNRPANCPAAPSLLSDFEEGSAVLVKQGGRDGWWYVYADMTTGMQTPASSTSAVAASLLQPAEGDCNKYAFHSTATGHPQYVGFGATLSPGTSASTKKAVSLEQYTGVSFRLRSGSGTQPPIWFEFLNKETQPADLSGTATGDQVDAYNTRGRLLDGIGTEWKTYTVPFGTLAPRYLPSDCAAGLKCEAPAFNSKSTLGLQFSLYDQFNTTGKYDLWVDDVNLTTGDAGLPTLTGTGMYPFPRDAAMANGCTKPTGASGKYLVEAFQNWKKTFVTNDQGNLRVKSPEIDNGATVSEGIAYGMLIAVFMNDRTLFDGLWAYWKAHPASGLLMNWKIPGGSGSASDADEDAAFALIQASKQWGGSYLTDAKSLLAQIASSEVEAGSYVLKPGNQFGGSDITNPSYFAPAYYRVFAGVDTGNATLWNGAVTSTYKLLNSIEGSNGLVPAWCQSNCTTRGGGGYKDADKYQYDSHRTPWRMALDVCWNNNADAKDYVNKVTSFFVGQSDTEGLGALVDLYEGGGTACSSCSSPPKSNSMSIIGTAAVGAMATGNAAHKAFLDRAWQFILDANYTADPTFKEGGYTYYNATVGLLTALTLTGNFNNF
jgi:endoglucanase